MEGVALQVILWSRMVIYVILVVTGHCLGILVLADHKPFLEENCYG
jgi:hypothetical protein